LTPSCPSARIRNGVPIPILSILSFCLSHKRDRAHPRSFLHIFGSQERSSSHMRNGLLCPGNSNTERLRRRRRRQIEWVLSPPYIAQKRLERMERTSAGAPAHQWCLGTQSREMRNTRLIASFSS
jgi:hypothetical protein